MSPASFAACAQIFGARPGFCTGQNMILAASFRSKVWKSFLASKPGVFIHTHDIFTLRNYLERWLRDEVKLWNEQYLLEALPSENPRLEIIGAVNFLKHRFPEEIAGACPVLAEEMAYREPGSLWLLRK